MNQFLHRLSTFVNWPSTALISPSKLAKTGFVYTGVRDRVRCYLCSAEIDGWENGNNPVSRHREVRQDCPVARGTDTLNDVAAGPEVGGRESLLRADDVGAVAARAPPSVSRPLRGFSARLATFKDWPKSDVVRPVDLGRVGFSYTSVRDEVVCSFCQTACRDWSVGDLPADEHRRLAPWCPFVRADFCRPIAPPLTPGELINYLSKVLLTANSARDVLFFFPFLNERKLPFYSHLTLGCQ